MATTWGDITIKAQAAGPPVAPVNLSEIPLVPDPDAPATTPQSVIMGVGRQRKRLSIQGHFTNQADWQSFRNDAYNHIKRTLVLNDGEVLQARILAITSATYKASITDKIWFTAEFIEADD